jgi:WD40 repeat protein
MPGLQDVVHRPHGYSNSTPAKGILRVHDLYHGGDFYLEAHDSAVSVVALNSDVSKIATASEKGTLIRVFDAVNPGLIREFRRGADRAVVYSLAFSPDSQFLVASSDTGTVHVFALHHGVENRRSRFSMLSGMFSYASSEWSFAWWKGPDVPCVCGFAPSGRTIYVVRANGEFSRLVFDPHKSGELCLAAA